jgi:hypothetical protein
VTFGKDLIFVSKYRSKIGCAESVKERDILEDLGVDVNMILK